MHACMSLNCLPLRIGYLVIILNISILDARRSVFFIIDSTAINSKGFTIGDRAYLVEL